MKNIRITIVISIMFIVLVVATTEAGNGEKWEAPPSAKEIINPLAKFKDTERALKAGAKQYLIQCMPCHGETGEGDGPSARTLEKHPKDLTSSEVQSQNDGEIFWKITHGKAPMPTFENILNPNQRWMIVNYIRTLGK